MKGKVVSEQNVSDAICKAQELISCLRTIRDSRGIEIENPGLIPFFAQEIENGKKWENVIIEIQALLLKELINRGHNNDKKLASLLGKNASAIKVYRCERKVYLRKTE